MRVVSLLPSATEILHFTGAGDTLVGVTHECDYPKSVESLPRLTSSKVDSGMTSAEIDEAVRTLTDEGSIYALDADLLAKLQPDLIVTQGLCEVCAVSESVVERAASALDPSPDILSLNPTSLQEVFHDTARIGDAVGRGDEARERVAALEDRLARVKETVAELSRPRVGCIEWLDPPFSAGHWVPEMVRIAGGEELFAAPGEPSARITWEEVFEAAPEVLVLMPCGFGVERAIEEARNLPELPGWESLPAVWNERVWAVDANSYFSRPAPRLVDGVEILAHTLHPRAFEDGPSPEAAKNFPSRDEIMS